MEALRRYSKINIADITKRKIDEALIKKLCYPSEDIETAFSILKDISSLGVDSLMLTCSNNPELVRVGKGYRGIVIVGIMKDIKVAIKILRSDSTCKSLLNEATMLSIANSQAIGPRLYGFTDKVIVTEYIEGLKLGMWFANHLKVKEEDIANVIKLCFKQCFKLDLIGLDHGELSNASDHIIVRDNSEPVIIDFGKSSNKRRATNLTSFASYILFNHDAEGIRNRLGIRILPKDLLRKYKNRPNHSTFMEIIKKLGI